MSRSRSVPTAAQIRASEPLTKRRDAYCSGDMYKLGRCAVCGLLDGLAGDLEVYREHDENDRPIPGPDALIALGRHHVTCNKVLEQHPRLYEIERPGDPGQLPALCADCVSRDGLTCRDPRTKANGGPGIMITMSLPPELAGIVCMRGPRGQNLAHEMQRRALKATACEGRIPKTTALDPAQGLAHDGRPVCPACGHYHQGEELAFICIGCPCEEPQQRPVVTS